VESLFVKISLQIPLKVCKIRNMLRISEKLFFVIGKLTTEKLFYSVKSYEIRCCDKVTFVENICCGVNLMFCLLKFVDVVLSKFASHR